MSLTAVLRRMGRGDVTAHGFRSTFRTWAAERTNFPREVVEAALAHASGDKIEAAYQRGDMLEKRRRLMAAWEGFAATPAGLRCRRRTDPTGSRVMTADVLAWPERELREDGPGVPGRDPGMGAGVHRRVARACWISVTVRTMARSHAAGDRPPDERWCGHI